jgi:RNA polymerase sigma factor (TIGR02999 family)
MAARGGMTILDSAALNGAAEHGPFAMANTIDLPHAADAPAFAGSGAAARAFPQVYADLKRIAHARLYRSGRMHDLETTALVHESFLRMVDRGDLAIADQQAFFGYVGRVMRGVVIDHVRRHHAAKRGGGDIIVTLTTDIQGESLDDERLLAINDALDVLERIAPAFHELVELRYFAGLSVRELAEMRGVSTRSVEREWEKARAFLQQLMEEA